MTNPSKAKGTRAETRVVKYLTTHGLKAKRQPLAGNKDLGDIIIEYPNHEDKSWILEVKTGKQTANPSRRDIKKWITQTALEASHAKASVGCLVVVRHNRRLIDADVYVVNMTPWLKFNNITRTTHMYFDEFVEEAVAYSKDS